jgi:hypothetical protein
MAKTPQTPEVQTPSQVDTSRQLVEALVQAINTTKPVEKKNPLNRKVNTPWTPKDGSPKLKLKRPAHQHGILINEDILSNEEIDLFNRLKPGDFCNGWVKVTKRRDRGIDIDYKVKTASDKLRLLNQFGIRSISELLQRCIDEASNPATYKNPEDE